MAEKSEKAPRPAIREDKPGGIGRRDALGGTAERIGLEAQRRATAYRRARGLI